MLNWGLREYCCTCWIPCHMAVSRREHICQQLYMLRLSYSVPSLEQIHFCCLARGEVVSWQISLGSHEHIFSKERVCQFQCGKFALQSVNIPDNTVVACRLLRIKFLISVCIFITHKSYYKQSHVLALFFSRMKDLEIINILLIYCKLNI
jgi:hypothetical protein